MFVPPFDVWVGAGGLEAGAVADAGEGGADFVIGQVRGSGVVVQQGPVLVTDTSPSGAITTYSGTEQQAPASGIPSP